MSPNEIVERHRAQFARVKGLSDSLDSAIDRNVNRRQTPALYARAYVAAVPVEDQGRLFGVLSKQSVTQLDRPYFLDRVPIIPIQYRPGFQALEFAQDFGDRMDFHGFVEFRADGLFVRVIPSETPEESEAEGVKPATFGDMELTMAVIASLEGMHYLHNHFEVDGSIMVKYGVSGFHLPAKLDAFEVGRHTPYDDEHVHVPIQGETEVVLEASTRHTRMLQAKVILDDLFAAFGWEGCAIINDDGFLENIPPYLKRHADEWNQSLRS